MSKLQVTLALAFLLALSTSAYALDCTDGDCPSGFVIYQQYQTENCTGPYTLYAAVNNTVPGQCSNTGSTYATVTCKAGGSTTIKVYANASCASNSYVYSQTTLTDTCLPVSGGSLVYRCDASQVSNSTRKQIKAVQTPSTVLVAPTLNAAGNNTNEGCNITTGCSKEYPTAFVWPLENGGCSGTNYTGTYPATSILPGYESFWLSIDSCFVSSSSSILNTTTMVTCKDGKAQLAVFAGNCQSSASVAVVTLNTDACLITNSFYFKMTCPGGSSASSLSFSGLFIVTLALVALLL